MAAFVSVNSEFKLAKQAVLGTPSTTGFICGRMKRSSVLPLFDELNPGAEHHCGNSNRPTLNKSHSIRTGYMGAFGASWFMYPQLIGLVLRGLGFDAAAPTGVAPTISHVFTIADRNQATYLTCIQQIGEGAEMIERRVTSGRVAKFDLLANSRGIVCSLGGMGTDIDDALGTETSTDEPDYLITATDGMMSAEIDGVPILTDMKIRSSRLQVMNPLDISDVTLFSPERYDLPQLGVTVNGALGGVDVGKTLWNKMYRNGASTGSPSLIIPSMDLSFKFESPANIPPAAAVPYSIQVDVPKAEVRMTPFEANDRNLIRCNLEWVMIDDGAEPITITLVNDKATYV
jgi:hypothetical protein